MPATLPLDGLYVTEDLCLPWPLIEAQRTGRLVIFAGAGVSMGTPSNLPSFKDLARRVAEGVLKPRRFEPLDAFFGRMEAHGLAPHSKARRILDDGASQPTSLHHDLLRLFVSPSAVRLVTTNFDRHFSTAAKQLRLDDLDIYCAPALPVGRDFAGIVYLHGHIDYPRRPLVLTDADFGQAYLTDAWAARFLEQVFREFTVLFVGYSHSDPPIEYLARGLTHDGGRYALVLDHNGREAHAWQMRGIAPIRYPLKNRRKKHRALGEGIAAWAHLSCMGTLDHEVRIRALVEGPPPLDGPSCIYILDSLRDPVTARFFFRYARHPEWLGWLRTNGVLDPLLDRAGQPDQAHRDLAVWIAECFLWDYPDNAVGVLQGCHIHEVLWYQLARIASVGSKSETPETLSRWAALLVDQWQEGWGASFLGYILTNCSTPDHLAAACLLFELLTRPHLRYGRRYSADTPAYPELAFPGEVYELTEAWEKVLRPRLPDIPSRLCGILEWQLTRAHLLLRASGMADDARDLPSTFRAAIEPHEQDRHPDMHDVLVDAARDVLEWLLIEKPRDGLATIERWCASGVPLLRRLGVHGVTKAMISANDKVQWLLDRDWFYEAGVKHEVFELLRAAYPFADDQHRALVLRRAMAGPKGHNAEQEQQRTLLYERYNLVVWLNRVAPSCGLTRHALAELQSKHQDFSPREYPDLDIVKSDVTWGIDTSLRAEVEHRDPSAESDARWLLTFPNCRPPGTSLYSRDDLLGAVREVVSRDPAWGLVLARALVEREEMRADLWPAIIQGWSQAILGDNGWRDVLATLMELPVDSLARDASRLLLHGVRHADDLMPTACIAIADEIADRAWEGCVDCEPAVGFTEERADWALVALNHPAGTLVQYWLLSLSSVTRREGRAGQDGIWERRLRQFEGVLSGSDQRSRLGAVLLLAQTHYLFALDAEWAGEWLVPRFDWSRDQIAAQQAWHGFLVWGQWNPLLLPHLLPHFIEGSARLADQLKHQQRSFCRHLAHIVVYSGHDPIAEGLLSAFVRNADADNRGALAIVMVEALRALPPNAREAEWDRWILRYWTLRNNGSPCPLTDEELSAMVEWALASESAFPRAVEMVTSARAVDLGRSSLYRDLDKSDLPDRYPVDAARLLAHLLAGAQEPFGDCDVLDKLVRRLSALRAPSDTLLRTCDQMGRLGCRSALELRALVTGECQ